MVSEGEEGKAGNRLIGVKGRVRGGERVRWSSFPR